MSPSANFATVVSGSDDPLALLPRTPVRRFPKGEIIYRPAERAETLYLVVEGRVKTSRHAENGREKEVVLDFYHKDEFFGEAGFLGAERYGEQAEALEPAAVMLWSLAELTRLMARTPALGPALLHVLAQKLRIAQDRIESFCLDPIHRRLARALVHLAGRAGSQQSDRLLHLSPTTHEQLARYVGTSREIVTQCMNQFRRDQLLKYSRRGLDLDLPALEKYLAKAS